MLILLWILGITAAVVWCDLRGDNVCQVEESYPVNVTEYFFRNATVRNYKWCMGFPPRCSFYTVKTVRIPRITEKYDTKIVKKCCPGYAENAERDACVPCMKCLEGTCGVEGKCICNSGFQGDDCANACEPMSWGVDCKLNCLCQHGSCDPRTGRCDCPTGWFGTRCELLCLEGFYGKHCINRCNCGERELCSPETGECVRKPTYQDRQSTRAIHYMTEDILNITQNIDKYKSTPSLKKYYSFDMEFSSPKPTYSRTTDWRPDQVTINNRNTYLEPNGNEKYSSPTRQASSTPRARWPSILNNSQKTTRKGENSNLDSVESTTEMSAEIERKDETFVIINENGSLEKKDFIDSINKMNGNKYSTHNIPEIIEGVLRTDKDNKSAKNNNYRTSSKDMNEKPFTKMSSSYEDTSQKRKEASKIAKDDLERNKIQSTKHKNSTTSLYVDEIKTADKNSAEINSKKPKIPVTSKHWKQNKSIVDSNNPSVTTPREDRSRKDETGRHNIGTKTSSKMSTSKKNLATKRNDISHKNSKLKNKLPEMDYISTTTIKITKSYPPINLTPPMPRNTPNPMSPNTEFTTDASISDFHFEYGLLANIPLDTKSTISISSTSEDKKNRQFVEEEHLQNLDSVNILTSKETSTPYGISITTVESSTFGKQGVLPLLEEMPSTRSFNHIGNDLTTSESTENKAQLKESSDSTRNKEENYLNDGTGEFDYSMTERSNLTTHMSIAALISLILIISMSGVILTHHYARKRKKRESKLKTDHQQKYSAGPTVSVYAHSIFHTPLPDPPIFENPIFASATENSSEHRTFQTHVVCNLNFAGHHTEEKEYTYDHPPSTGSYRAASIPEPPDINEPSVTAEPVYDEIPSHERANHSVSPPPSYKSACIYVNTCGKTRF